MIHHNTTLIDSWLEPLTNVGDSALTLPVALIVVAWLLIWHARRAALGWFIGLMACGGVTAALKVYFKACPVPGIDLDSPSGHTAMSFFVYGGLILITVAQTRGWRRAAILGFGTALILGIAVSRFVLNYHSRAEVVIGFLVGGSALALFWLLYRRYRPARMPLWPLWIAALVPMVALHGHRVSAEGLIAYLSSYIRSFINFCV